MELWPLSLWSLPVHFEPQGELNCIRPLQGLGSMGMWDPGKSWTRGQAAAS